MPKPKKRAARGPRAPKARSPLRLVVARNFKARLIFLYGHKTYPEWAKLTGLSQGTLQRILAKDSGLTVEVLEQAAKSVQLHVPHLFMPLAAPDRTGEIVVLEPGQKALWDRFLQLKNDLGGPTQ